MTTIKIYGPVSRIEGEYPLAAVREATSYPVEGAHFSKAFKKGLWDGRKHLFKPGSGAFPTGLLDIVTNVLDVANVSYTVEDQRANVLPKGNTFELQGISMEGKYSYQLDACKTAVEKKQGILKLPTSAGKCLHPDTRIRMFDGTVKSAKDICIGDLLMGPDSNPRTVKSTCTGTGPMFRIVPNKGNSWICNDVHVLTLRNTQTGDIVDIPLNEYLAKSNNFKHLHKQFSVGVEYPECYLPIDPYFLGLWLGDGMKSLSTLAITTADVEIESFVRDFAENHGMRITVDDHKNNASSTYHITQGRVGGVSNPLVNKMRILFEGGIRIPEVYKVSSRIQRLKLLAGLIDSDGHCSRGRYYEIAQIRKELAEDIVEVAQSLGMRALISEKVVNTTSYWRVTISGDISLSPYLLLDKKKIQSNRKRTLTNTGFKVEALGFGDYCGFTLDLDGRFLLADYTVTHNTEIAAAIIRYLELPTLFLVTTRELLYQGQQRFMKRLGLTEKEIGIVGDGVWSPGSLVTVATVDTVESRYSTDECQDLLSNTEVLFVDECHHTGSETFYEVCMACPATYRFGLSGTPLDRTDGANLRLLAAIGPIIVNVASKTLYDLGILARTNIIFTRISQPPLPKKTTYANAYKKGIVENPNLLEKIVEWTVVFQKAGLSTLILCEEIAHGKIIDAALWQQDATGGEFVPHVFIHGSETTEQRSKALLDFGERRLPVLIASTILDEGVDVPTIDALILAGSRKSRIKTMQRLGRGLRGNKLIAVEFANFTHDYLLKHSLQRYNDYKAEQCFPVIDSNPNLELVKKLWEKD